MQKLIQCSHHASKSSRRSVRGSISSNSSVLSVDTDTTFDGLDSSLFCQQIGSIPHLEFDKFIEEVRRPLFALTAGTTSTEDANDQLRYYYLVQKFTENRIGNPDNKQNFLYLYKLHSLTRGVVTVCKTTYIFITGISFSAITGNASRNIPNTMCDLVGTFLISAKMFLIPCVLSAISGTISNIFLIPNNIRNNLSVPDIMRNHFTMFLIWRCLFSLYDNLLVI
jgi:hypothetical protein